MKNYTAEERRLALEASLTAVARYYGFTPVRIGHYYTLTEMNSIRIYNDRSYFRWSEKEENGHIGGSQIDFLLEYCNCESVVEAIHTLLAIQGISNTRILPSERVNMAKEPVGEKEKVPFILPKPAQRYNRAYAYLTKTRGLSVEVVNYMVRDKKLLYEDAEHHNLVFLGKDKDGEVKYATKRGTADLFGKKFRGDVAGNDKNFGVNIVNLKCDRLKVFEAAIDMMSYLDVTGDYESNKLVLGMVSDNPLEQFLKDYDHIKNIDFCLDNDEAGLKAVYGTSPTVDMKTGEIIKERKIGLIEKYESRGYHTTAHLVPDGEGKDWNGYLLYLKENKPYEVAALKKNTFNRKAI